MPQDQYEHAQSVTSPARASFTITPSNSVELTEVPKAIYVGTGGDITLRMVDSIQDNIFRNVPTGAVLPIRPSSIRSNGTTASDLIGLV